MISTKKYLFILLGFLIAIMYLNSASVLARGIDKIERVIHTMLLKKLVIVILMKIRKKFLRGKKRDIFRKAGLSYTATLAEDWSMLHVTMG